MPITQFPIDITSGSAMSAPTWYEQNVSGETTVDAPSGGGEVEKNYVILGAPNESVATAITQYLTTFPTGTYGTLTRIDGTVLTLYKFKLTPQEDGTTWFVALTYKFAAISYEMTHDQQGGGFKQMQGFDPGPDFGEYYDAGGLYTPYLGGDDLLMPSLYGAINADTTKGTTAGVDVDGPAWDFSIFIRYPLMGMPPLLLESIMALKGTCNGDFVWGMPSAYVGPLPNLAVNGGETNNAGVVIFTWNGQTYTFFAEELYFRGMSPAKETSDGTLEITLRFSVQRTTELPNVGLSNAINGGPIVKIGWRYAQPYYEMQPFHGRQMSRPSFMVINKVLPGSDFSLIFGTLVPPVFGG
jgi:hypothetical protein